MTEPESPSALLERAAATLERLGPRSRRGLGGDGDLLGYGPTPIVYSEYGDVEVQWASGTFEWICRMSPAVAPPLVEWLRHSATSVREHDEDLVVNGEPSRYCPNEEQALTFARLVLGEPKNSGKIME